MYMNSPLDKIQSTQFVIGQRTGLVVRASDSGSGDPQSSAGSVCCFLEQETFTPQKYW